MSHPPTSPPHPPEIGYRPDIDGLRGVAVLLVVGYHAFPSVFRGGFIGVDIFFVISGFLISSILARQLDRGTFSLADFYVRRVRRIFPALILTLTLTALSGWLMLSPGEFRQLGLNIAGGSAFAANLVCWRATVGGYFAPAAEDNPLLHLWSLGIEEQFYLLHPLLLAALWRTRAPVRYVALCFAGSLLICVAITEIRPIASFFLPITRAWELLAGALVALAARRRVLVDANRPRPPSRLPLVIGVVALALSILVIPTPERFPGWRAILPVAAASGLIAAGPHHWIGRRILGNRFLVLVGLFSYPLYLWHWPVLVLGRLVHGTRLPAWPTLGLVGLAVGLAIATWRWLEMPIRRGWPGRPQIPILCAGLGGLAVTGLLMERGLVSPLWHPQKDALFTALADRHFFPIESNNWNRPPPFVSLVERSRLRATTLFIGDSHVEMLYPRVQFLITNQPDAARTAQFITCGAWPPLPGVNRGTPDTYDDQLFEFAFQEALRPEVEVVVLGAFWEHYLLGTSFGNPGPTVGIRLAGSGPDAAPLRLGSPELENVFRELEHRILTLTGQGKAVHILLPTPSSPAFHPRQHLRKWPWQFTSLAHPNGPVVPRDEFIRYTGPIRERLERIAAAAGARTIDPVETLCGDRSCPGFLEDGTPIYTDSHHLRPEFARRHASFIDETILIPTP